MKLLPDSLRIFAINRVLELSGLLIATLCIFVFISVISHSPFDPSINNLNSSEVTNLGGHVGANISDLLIQLFGYFSLLICPVLISWSYKIFFTKKLQFEGTALSARCRSRCALASCRYGNDLNLLTF